MSNNITPIYSNSSVLVDSLLQTFTTFVRFLKKRLKLMALITEYLPRARCCARCIIYILLLFERGTYCLCNGITREAGLLQRLDTAFLRGLLHEGTVQVYSMHA